MRILVFLFVMFSTAMVAQISDDFSDGNLDQNPTWLGDLANFQVNANAQLQLNAPDEGESFLYTNVNFGDSTEWNLWFEMDFSPSGSNQLQIYLYLDNEDLNVANGYYLEIGETGSNDAINFYEKEGATTTLLGSASMGAVAIEPAIARISVKFSNGIWTLKADYSGGDLLLDELMLTNDDVPILSSGYFGFYCDYTVGRKDLFFFDDVEIKIPEQDLVPPSLITVDLIENDEIKFTYNEILNEQSLSSSQITLGSFVGNIVSVDIDPIQPNAFTAILSEELSSGIVYQICTQGIEDLASNPSVNECQDIFTTVDPDIGDLFINEILFNPNVNATDFVEIINVSDKFISLDNVLIANTAKDEFKAIQSGIYMLPDEIIAFTKNPDDQISIYNPSDPNQIITQEIPSFNADEGNVSIQLALNNEIISLDSFDYSEDMHFDLLDTEKGVSLEKIIPSSESNADNAWQSASEQVQFATPGYENSNRLALNPSEEMISFSDKVISPNGDGDKDVLGIRFSLDNPGYLASVEIFDDRGFLVRQLSNNVLLGPESFVYWDGITDEGSIAEIGIYVVLVELFDLNGSVAQTKETVVVADFLD